MTKPKAFDPEPGYHYQILCRYDSREWEHCDYASEWEHCDYAKDKRERDYLLGEYRLAYGNGYQFKTIPY
jgi:hypothetical protein